MSKLHQHNQQLVKKFIKVYSSLRKVMRKISTMSHEDKVTTILQFEALSYVSENKKATVGELATHLNMSSSAIAQLIDRLIASRKIVRSSDDQDRRIVHIALTTEGKKELVRIQAMHVEKMNYILSHITESDLNELIRIQMDMITKLEENL